jgi:hypothetical protein
LSSFAKGGGSAVALLLLLPLPLLFLLSSRRDAVAVAFVLASLSVIPEADLPFALLLLFGLAWGFSPTTKSRQEALPLCRRPERSPKGEATDLLPLLLLFQTHPKNKSKKVTNF